MHPSAQTTLKSYTGGMCDIGASLIFQRRWRDVAGRNLAPLVKRR